MILCRVQHHPSRADLIPPLLKALVPLVVEVSTHESIPPDPWGGYKQCLSGIPREASHLLVIQDDAQPVLNFAESLVRVAESNPNVPICLFLGAYPASTAAQARRASLKGKNYVPLGPSSFVPLVAVLWPRRKAEEFLAWSRTQRMTRADDGNAAKWAKRTRQQIMVTVPSLVEHNDFVPSVKGGRDHEPGAEAWRHAALLAEDGLSYDW